MLITELNRVGKFQVLESAVIEDLADEIRLGETGYVGEQERFEKGGWAACGLLRRNWARKTV